MDTQKIKTETTCNKCNHRFKVTGKDLIDNFKVKCLKCGNEFIPFSSRGIDVSGKEKKMK